jgi:hypothetical protein
MLAAGPTDPRAGREPHRRVALMWPGMQHAVYLRCWGVLLARIIRQCLISAHWGVLVPRPGGSSDA